MTNNVNWWIMKPKVTTVSGSNHKMHQNLYDFDGPMSLHHTLTLDHKGYYYDFVFPLHTLELESFY